MKISNVILKIAIHLLAVGCLLSAPISANAAIYLFLDGIAGEVTADGYQDWIELDTVNEGLFRAVDVTGSTGGSTTDRVNFNEISVTKLLDISSVYLRQKLAEGRPIPRAFIAVVAIGVDAKQEYFRIELTNAFLTSISMSTGGDRPTENASFKFEEIVWKFTPYDKEGNPGSTIPAGYDLKTNTKI